MIKTEGSITTNDQEAETTNHLLVYSEEEKQNNEINEANAKLVFTPAHIQYYPSIKSKYNITHVETLLYGFITYYLHSGTGRFYFTNEQLATVLDCSERTIKSAIATLMDKGLVEFSYRIKAGGGTIRFAKGLGKNRPSDGQKSYCQTVQKLPANKNKIIENNISTNVDISQGGGETVEKIQTWGNEDVNSVLEAFKELTGLSKPLDREPRYWAWQFVRVKGMGAEKFRPCLKWLMQQWGDRVEVTKIEQVYRHFPEYERHLQKTTYRGPSKKVEFTDSGEIIVRE